MKLIIMKKNKILMEYLFFFGIVMNFCFLCYSLTCIQEVNSLLLSCFTTCPYLLGPRYFFLECFHHHIYFPIYPRTFSFHLVLHSSRSFADGRRRTTKNFTESDVFPFLVICFPVLRFLHPSTHCRQG